MPLATTRRSPLAWQLACRRRLTAARRWGVPSWAGCNCNERSCLWCMAALVCERRTASGAAGKKRPPRRPTRQRATHCFQTLTLRCARCRCRRRGHRRGELHVWPTAAELRLPSKLFRIVLLRRLRMSLPASARACRCGRPAEPCHCLPDVRRAADEGRPR